MKKILLTTILAISVFSAAIADNIAGVSDVVLSNFKNDFKRASEITWVTKKDFVKAVFTMNNVKMEAFYKVNGDWIGTSKQIDLEELPVNAKRTFAKKYQNHTVKEAIYFEGPEESAYFISATKDDESVILKVDQSTQLSIFKKTRNRNG